MHFLPENQQCTPSCKCKDKAQSLAEITSGAGGQNGQNGQNAELELPSLEPFCKPIPPILRSLHDDLNSRILRRSIDRAFEAHAELPDLKPQRTFEVLAKLAEITHRACKNGEVPRRFLDTAVDVFKVAHEGRGFYFHEDLAPRDYKYIMKALEHCLDDVDPLEFYQTDCDGAVSAKFNCILQLCVCVFYIFRISVDYRRQKRNLAGADKALRRPRVF